MTENKLATSLYGELQQAQPVITPKESPYTMVKQGTVTNTLSKITPTKYSQPINIDNIAGTATYQQDRLSVTIPLAKDFEGLKDSTHHLFRAITREFTLMGGRDKKVVLHISEYMELRGLRDKKEAVKQVRKDLDALTSIKISWENNNKNSKATGSFGFINIAEKGGYNARSNTIEFTFTQSFYDILKTYNAMPYPDKLFKINSKRNPYSRALGEKLAEGYNMDYGKPKQNIYTVKNLLKQCYGMPSYEEVMKGGRDVTRKIIDPFIRDMDALEEAGILSYHFLHKDNTPLTDKELDRIAYSDFITLKVITTWYDYPTEIQEAKLERKSQKIEANKKKAKRGRPKKTD